jgi:hypothetical protein
MALILSLMLLPTNRLALTRFYSGVHGKVIEDNRNARRGWLYRVIGR